MRYLLLLFLLSSLVLISSCSDQKYNYRYSQYFSEQQRDSLLVDIVTLVGKKPKTADYITRHEPQFREYYKQLSQDFSVEFFHIADDTCYYYMIRPARNAKGNIRGVGGKLTLDKNNEIVFFEESFNTPVYSSEKLKEIGWRLFRELIEKRSIEGLLWNVDYIEWPDSRLKYDRNKREWRYDVENEQPVDR